MRHCGDGDLADLPAEVGRAETAVLLQADASILTQQRTEEDSEAQSVGAVSPSSSSPPHVAAVQRGHVASLAVVGTSVLAAAHLADGGREHNLEPVHGSAP